MSTHEISRVLPAGLTLGAATLSVADLSRSVAFYEEMVGLRTIERTDDGASLGGEGGADVIRLVEKRGVRPKSHRSAGLFHVAILLPARRDLALAFARLARAKLLTGASDHLVSEAIYFEDPDGSGLEIYCDRPRERWSYADGRVKMATKPIDAEALAALLAPGEDVRVAAPAETRIGHVHLQVGDLEAARAFWVDACGFEITATYPGALFMSAGGYHHHLAANVWRSAGSGPPPADAAGLVEFEIRLPEASDLDAIADRLRHAGLAAETGADGALTAADPWANRFVLRAV